MSNEVTIVNICSLIIGNNLPWDFHPKDQLSPAEEERTEPLVAEDESQAAETAAKPDCPWRRLLRQVLIIGGLALFFSLWCGRRGKREVEAE